MFEAALTALLLAHTPALDAAEAREWRIRQPVGPSQSCPLWPGVTPRFQVMPFFCEARALPEA